MGFWNRSEADLERELRAQRPRPREEFVQMLGRQFVVSRTRRSFRVGPRVALVAAATVVLAASLGVAGAVGYAKSSVKSFSASVYHIVQTPSAKSTLTSFNAFNQQNAGNDAKRGKGGSGDARNHDDHGDKPSDDEYDHDDDICHNGHMESVPSHLYFYDIEHGKDYRPAHDCRHHKKH